MVLQRRVPGGGMAHGGRGKERKGVNLLLIILEFLLPFCDQRLSLKERQLVERCKDKLGDVSELYGTSVLVTV